MIGRSESSEAGILKGGLCLCEVKVAYGMDVKHWVKCGKWRVWFSTKKSGCVRLLVYLPLGWRTRVCRASDDGGFGESQKLMEERPRVEDMGMISKERGKRVRPGGGVLKHRLSLCLALLAQSGCSPAPTIKSPTAPWRSHVGIMQEPGIPTAPLLQPLCFAKRVKLKTATARKFSAKIQCGKPDIHQGNIC